jgi:RNA recognition motif-containing protein
MSYPVSQTIYVHNLNNKVHKDALRKQLYLYFTQFGRIMAIVASKRPGLEGQAWIVFEDDSCATKALKDSQGFELLGKNMRVEYCTTKSDVVAQEDGTWIHPKNRPPGTGADGKPPARKIEA